jgi:hypothetical protein
MAGSGRIADILATVAPFLRACAVEIRSRAGRVTLSFSGTVPLTFPGLGDRHEVKRASLEAELSGEAVVVYVLEIELASPLKRAGFAVWGGPRRLLATLAKKGLAAGTIRSVQWGREGEEGTLPATFRFS